MFKELANKINQQLNIMHILPLFEADIDRDELWALYLSSFTPAANPIYRKRTEHDCSCCKNFIRDAGGIMALMPTGQVVTVWDVALEGPLALIYQPVVDALAGRVRAAKIKNVYTSISAKVGTQVSRSPEKSWNHFYGTIPGANVGITPTSLSEILSGVAVFKRGLEEITEEALATVIELITQRSVYRGEEFLRSVTEFRELKRAYVNLTPYGKEIFVWQNRKEHSARIRNTAIGTLLQDISEGVELDRAVASFEAKVAPENYRRPTPVLTKAMIDSALAALREDGLERSLERRYAVVEDMNIRDILYADRNVKPHMQDGLASLLQAEVSPPPKDFSKVTEIGIEDFLRDILPGVESMEAYFENNHAANLVSLVAPVHADAPGLFSWGNPFSWSYDGNLTDGSIKQRVKAAGGRVDGFLRVSLSWFNYDDLDLHVFEPNGGQIYFAAKRGRSGGILDVDMNAGGSLSRQPVENIVWPTPQLMMAGTYKISVHNFARREAIDVGFEVEIECRGQVFKLAYPKPVSNKHRVDVADVVFDVESITVAATDPNITTASTSQAVWDISTNAFHKVSMVTLSPNHWGEQTGNKHYMFILDKCRNPEQARGFYNEFLPGHLNKHRKVLEVLADKTKCPPSDSQLSGLGFSSTRTAELVCKVTGRVNRVLKIKF